jgi:hypothetical protein
MSSKARFLAAAAVLALAGACSGEEPGDTAVPASPDGQRVAIGQVFELDLPAGLQRMPRTGGGDSLARVYRGPGLHLLIDLGRYSDPLTEVEGDQVEREQVQVAGRPATRVTWRDTTPGNPWPLVAAIHFSRVRAGTPEMPGAPATRLTLVARGADASHREVGLKVFRSIHFLESSP